jgi:CRP-like cAMP-binding protein
LQQINVNFARMSATIIPASQPVNELYAGLPIELRKELETHEQEIKVPRGYKLLQHHVPSGRLVILSSGRVEISVPCGGHEVLMGTAGPGKVFGMRAAVSGEVPEINVTCLEECEITVIPAEDFNSILRDNPQMYFAVARVLSADLKIADQLIRNCARRASAIARNKNT